MTNSAALESGYEADNEASAAGEDIRARPKPAQPVSLRISSGCLSRMACANSRKKANIAKSVPKQILLVDELPKIFLLLFY
jgi:hypothetical protein